MKKTLLILAISALTLSLNAYVPMLQNGNTWTYLSYRSIYPGLTKFETVSRSILGDTTIDNLTYSKSNFTKLLLREDTSSQKVFIFDPLSNTEELLYDFSLNVGDSAEIFNEDKHSIETLIGLKRGHITDSAYYKKIFITSIDIISDIEGNKLRLFHFTTYDIHGNLNEEGCYAERYGAFNSLLHLYNSQKGYSGKLFYSFRCFADHNGKTEFVRHDMFDNHVDSEHCQCNSSNDSIDSKASARMFTEVSAKLTETSARKAKCKVRHEQWKCRKLKKQSLTLRQLTIKYKTL